MIHRISKSLARLAGFRRAQEGTIAAEFALAAPVLLLLVSGMVDLGLALDQSSSLSNAARAGAQYAVRFPSDTSGITQVVAKAMNADPSDLTVNANLTCECPGGGVVGGSGAVGRCDSIDFKVRGCGRKADASGARGPA